MLIVDEAGMAGTRDIAALADAAGRAQAKLVLVGDDRQLPEIDAGGAFRARGPPPSHRHEPRFYVTAGQDFLNQAPEPLRDGDLSLHVVRLLADSRAEHSPWTVAPPIQTSGTRPMTTQVIDEGPPPGLTRAEPMTARGVAELLSLPISTARERGRNRAIPRVKLGRRVRYIRRHVEAAILDAEQRGNDRTPNTAPNTLVQHPGPAASSRTRRNRPLSTKAPWREGASV